MRKRRDHTEFACYVRNVTSQPVCLTVPFGEMERRPKLSAGELALLLEQNRARFAAEGTCRERPGERRSASAATGLDLGAPDLL